MGIVSSVMCKTDVSVDHLALPRAYARHVGGQTFRHDSKLSAATGQLCYFAL